MIKQTFKGPLASLLFLSVTPAAFAQDTAAEFVPDRGPNEYTVACLKAPTQKCALEAAVETAIRENLGGERARVLAGVGEALLSIGQIDRAKKTLMIALEEAQSAGLTLIYQEKIQQIAPLLARADDTVSALALAGEARYGVTRDRLLSKIAREAAAIGDIAGMKVALKQFRKQSRAFWEELNQLVNAPNDKLKSIDLAALEEQVLAFDRSDYVHRGLTLLAAIAYKKGDQDLFLFYLDRAKNRFNALISEFIRLEQLALRIDILHRAGAPLDIIEQSYAVLERLETSRIQGSSFEAYSKNLLAFEASTNRLDRAFFRLERYTDIEKRLALLPLLKLQNADPATPQLEALITKSLDDLGVLESAYERDAARLTILRCAIANSMVDQAMTIVGRMEDDDSQAVALALSAKLLQ